MARLLYALLFVFLAVVAGVESAADKGTAKPPATATATSGGGAGAAEAPIDDNAIGTTDGDDGDATAASPGEDDVAVAGPVGSDSTYANYPPPQSTNSGDSSGATALGVSTATVFAAATATAGWLFFY